MKIIDGLEIKFGFPDHFMLQFKITWEARPQGTMLLGVQAQMPYVVLDGNNPNQGVRLTGIEVGLLLITITLNFAVPIKAP